MQITRSDAGTDVAALQQALQTERHMAAQLRATLPDHPRTARGQRLLEQIGDRVRDLRRQLLRAGAPL